MPHNADAIKIRIINDLAKLSIVDLCTIQAGLSEHILHSIQYGMAKHKEQQDEKDTAPDSRPFDA